MNDPVYIDLLNAVLKHEIRAMGKYITHSAVLSSWGVNKLAEHERREGLEEADHALAVAQCIADVGENPNLEKLPEIPVGSTIKGILENDLSVELEAMEALYEAHRLAVAYQDEKTARVLKRIIDIEIGHREFFENELSRLADVGEERYREIMG